MDVTNDLKDRSAAKLAAGLDEKPTASEIRDHVHALWSRLAPQRPVVEEAAFRALLDVDGHSADRIITPRYRLDVDRADVGACFGNGVAGAVADLTLAVVDRDDVVAVRLPELCCEQEASFLVEFFLYMDVVKKA